MRSPPQTKLLSLSPPRRPLPGGLCIATLVGMDHRSTLDADAVLDDPIALADAMGRQRPAEPACDVVPFKAQDHADGPDLSAHAELRARIDASAGKTAFPP